MRLLLDECIGDRSFRNALALAGHDVVRSIDIVGGGATDEQVLALAIEQQRVLITFNNRDFIELAASSSEHPGMLLVYQDNRPGDLSTETLMRAIANVESTYNGNISGEVLSLNNFQWSAGDKER